MGFGVPERAVNKMYNLTNLTGSAGLYDLVSFGNEVTQGLFVTLMLGAIFIILFMSMKRDTIAEPMAAASFMCFVLGLILRYVGLVSFKWIAVYLVLLVASAVFIVYNKRS